MVLDPLLVHLEDSASLAPLLGLLVGIALSISPISLPSIPAVMALVSPGRVEAGERSKLPLTRSGPFVMGMDGVVGMTGFALVELTRVPNPCRRGPPSGGCRRPRVGRAAAPVPPREVANEVGLLATEYDAQLGRQRRNFLQAFSHVGLGELRPGAHHR